MVETVMSLEKMVIRWADVIEYSEKGIQRKTLLEDANCKYVLVSIPAGTEIAEHSAPRNATVNVIEGEGVLTLKGEDIALESGVFVFMPGTAPHALKAVTNLTFLLTFSEQFSKSDL